MVSGLFVDHNGTLWTLPETGDVDIQWINRDRSKFAWYRDDIGKSFRNYEGSLAVDFAEAPDSTVWLATAKGLYHWFPKTDSFKLVEAPQYYGKQMRAGAVRIDKNGRVWYDVYLPSLGFQGLDCYDPHHGTFMHYKHDDKNPLSIKINMVHVITIDKTGNIWTGGDNGYISCFNQKTSSFTSYQLVNPKMKRIVGARDFISYLYEDKSGVLWACPNSGGIAQLDKATGTFNFRFDILLKTQTSGYIIEDSKNRLWMSTVSSGIYCFDSKTNQTRR